MKNLEKKFSVAAYIDILGYKELLLKESENQEIEMFNDLKETINIALDLTVVSTKKSIDFIDAKFENSEQLSKRLNAKQFSDNIYFSFDYQENSSLDLFLGVYIITNISLLYQRLMMGKGYFVRGGIACGLNMVDKNFIFSTALIKSVEIEKETIYPRITIQKELIGKFLNAGDNPFKELIKKLLIQDWSEHIFLNPFLNYAERVVEAMNTIPQEYTQSLIDNATKKQRKLIKILTEKFADYFDFEKYNSMVRVIIEGRMNEYKNKERSIYEKYLWTKNLLNWVDNKPSEPIFKYLPSINELPNLTVVNEGTGDI